VTVGIFEFNRCVNWGFHKKMNPKKKTAESVTFFSEVVCFLEGDVLVALDNEQ
jgi:hypothetical protein